MALAENGKRKRNWMNYMHAVKKSVVFAKYLLLVSYLVREDRNS